MEFTMKYTAHPERKAAYEKMAEHLGLITAQHDKGSPWKNGIVERSHRTDNEELFERIHFQSSEERKYLLKLWEYEYNTRRPHQSLAGQCPLEVFIQEYRMIAYIRMLT